MDMATAAPNPPTNNPAEAAATQQKPPEVAPAPPPAPAPGQAPQTATKKRQRTIRLTPWRITVIIYCTLTTIGTFRAYWLRPPRNSIPAFIYCGNHQIADALRHPPIGWLILEWTHDPRPREFKIPRALRGDTIFAAGPYGKIWLMKPQHNMLLVPPTNLIIFRPKGWMSLYLLETHE